LDNVRIYVDERRNAPLPESKAGEVEGCAGVCLLP
jgi:hypothetical protein